nr:hypothetical protein Itr_chr11CG12730 [Ipomoea trifida]
MNCLEEAIAAILRCFGVESSQSAAENPIGEPLLQPSQPTDDDNAPPPDDGVDPMPITITAVAAAPPRPGLGNPGDPQTNRSPT